MRRCIRDRSSHFKRSWFFNPKQSPPHPFGWARLVFDCDLRGPEAKQVLTLFYGDENGIRFRTTEYEERRENF